MYTIEVQREGEIGREMHDLRARDTNTAIRYAVQWYRTDETIEIMDLLEDTDDGHSFFWHIDEVT